MKKIKKVFICIITLCAVFPAFARDKSVDCAGRPRWDRFVVDEKSDQWDPKSAECFGTVTKVDSNAANLYGKPGLYGEYVEGTGTARAATSGAMYGTYNPNSKFEKHHPKPIRAAAAKPAVSDSKHPVVSAPVAPKSIISKPEPLKVAPKPTPIVVAPAPKPVVKPEPKPVVAITPKPTPIATTVTLPAPVAQNTPPAPVKEFNIDSYCTEINPAVRGPLPKGLVLMPGRPDLMSCVKK